MRSPFLVFRVSDALWSRIEKIAIYNNSLSHEGGSQGVSKVSEVSEQTSEYSGAWEGSEQGGESKRVSGASERANGRASGSVLQSRFLVILAYSGMISFSPEYDWLTD